MRPALSSLVHAIHTLRLSRDGAEYLPGAATTALDALGEMLAPCPGDLPGIRLAGIPALSRLLGAEEAIGKIAARCIGAEARPVRALLFDKSPAVNWALGWHQDRVIAVERRIDVAGFGPWTIKKGLVHVGPPFEILARMLTLRVHLDPVPLANAPLLIAPGTHRAVVREDLIAAEVDRKGVVTCIAETGDVWLYATPILHASDAAEVPARRRVLQIDYAAFDLPGGLAWLGV